MSDHVSRRRLLVGTLSGAGAIVLGSSGSRARQQGNGGGFVPVQHGFGFRNWTARNQYFEAPPGPSTRSVREEIRSEWHDPARSVLGLDTAVLSRGLIDAMASQVRTAIVQQSGTNGHCYGMVLTAQRYFESPESIPVDRTVASEIDDPTVPVRSPEAPVYEAILRGQARQFLKFRAWLGRRAMLYPDRIDTRQVLQDVQSVVDRFGTATLSLFDDSLSGHQVLAYDFEEHDDGVTVPIYDPNRAAPSYRGGSTTLRFQREDTGFSMQPYRHHTNLLFNRFDQIERAAERETASPLDHLTIDRSTVLASLFPLAVFTVDAENVEIAVVGPDGDGVDRMRGTHMDRTQGETAGIRTRYGASPGTYRIGVFATDTTDYELTTMIADTDRTLVDESRTATIDLGERHEYVLEVAEEGSHSLDRSGGGSVRPTLVGGAGAVVGATVGAVGYRTVTEFRSQDDPDERSS